MATTSGSADDAGGRRAMRRTSTAGPSPSRAGRSPGAAGKDATSGEADSGPPTAAVPLAGYEAGAEAVTPPPGPMTPPPGPMTPPPGPMTPPPGPMTPPPEQVTPPTEPAPRLVPPPPGGPLPTTRRGMLRYRVLPRSVVGLSMLILSFAIGAGFSGVVLFSYYQYKQDQANAKVNALISGYKGQFAKAEADLNAAVAAAKANIQTQLKGVQNLQTGPAQLASLIKQLAPSVFFVHTLDASGQPSVGTAFVVSSSSSQSLLLTSYTTVAAATRSPGPQVFVSQGDNGAQTPVTVRTWDPQYDLALLILSKGGLPAVPVAPTSPAPQPGDQVFVASGLGSAGASLEQGTVIDVSSSGLEIDAPIGTPFQGGPVLDKSGEVMAVGSRSYAPLGFAGQGTYFAPFVEAACNKVLSCPGGTLAGSH